MVDTRDLEWQGCVNVRDLGGLPAADGRQTRPGAVVRGDHPRNLTAVGWEQLWDHGIRTVVSLHTATTDPATDRRANRYLAPGSHRPGLTNTCVAIEDGDDAEFMNRWAGTGLWGTPLYFADALTRWPERHAAAVAAVARAESGGVLIHCVVGCDRTGILALLLLAAVGVAPHDIAADYARSIARLEAREPGCRQRVTDLLAERGTTASQIICDLLHGLNAESYLRDGGLSHADLAALRRRLTVPTAA